MLLTFTVLFTIFMAEMGDKTQLLLVAMSSKYKVRHILIGTWAATALLSLLAVVAGATLSQYLDMRVIKMIAGLAFFWFAYASLKPDDEEEEAVKEQGKFGPVAAIFGSFFIGELGDKTQLSGVALAATYCQGSITNAFYVFLGCTLGLILADLIGLIVGLVLKNKMPTGILNTISFFIFAIFGASSIYTACGLIFGKGSLSAVLVCIAIVAAFALLCVFTYLKNRKRSAKE